MAALCVAGCGNGGQPATSPRAQTKLPRSVSQQLWAALDRPAQLRRLTIAAVNSRRVPAALQETLLSTVNAYAEHATFRTKLHVRAWLLDHAAAPTRQGLLVPRSQVEGPSLLIDLWQVLIDASDAAGRLPAAATPAQRTLAALMSADGEINNGGFDQLFANEGADAVREAVAAAERIDSPVHARLLRSALADRRDAVLARLDDRWYDEERVLERRLRAYVDARPEQFFSDA